MIKFGTSGFRGIIADNFTKESVMRVAYSLSLYVKQNHKTKLPIVVGFDNRFMGREFAQWFTEVLIANNLKVKFFNIPTPSPLIAYETKDNFVGVHITASHNPYYYNGIKIFQKGGRETTAEQNIVLENLANEAEFANIKTINFNVAVAENKILISKDILPYCNSILSQLNFKNIANKKIKVLFNAMKGSSVECGEYLLKKLKINYQIVNGDVNPNFNFSLPSPYKQNLIEQAKQVKKEKFSLGFALDGDGDRVSFIDEKGEFYDCNYISALIYDYFVNDKNLPCNFVKNCALTELIDIIADSKNYKGIDAKVGFKNIAQEMQNDRIALLGAESNGIAFKNHILHKDGLLTALIVIEILSDKNKPLSELIKKLKAKYNYPAEVVEYAYPCTDKQKEQITKKVFEDKILPNFNQTIIEKSYIDGAKFIFKNNYWCVVRFSGNENVLRLFAEMPNLKQSEQCIKVLEQYVGLSIKQK